MRPVHAKNIMFCLLFLLPTLSFAGEIFGTLKKDGKPLAKQEIKISQAGKEIGVATTDEKGYFSFTVKPVGKCTLTLTGYDGTTFDVFSTNNSSGYTLSLVKEADKWVLKKL